MKKICFFMETPFTLGGEQRVVSILSNMLVEKGFNVSILCTNLNVPVNYDLYNLDSRVKIDYLDGFNNKYVVKLRKRRIDLDIKNLYKGKYKNSLLMEKFINCDFITFTLLKNKINKEKYDYVISLGMYNKMLARVSKHVKAKVIGWQHSSSKRYFEFLGEWYYNQDKFVKYMFNSFDEYIVLTDKDKKYIKNRYNFEPVVINNPKSIHSDKVTNLKNKYFIAVGRFISVKNFSVLIDMFNEFHKIDKTWKLRIVGEGDLKDEYIKKIKEYKLEKYVEIVDYTKDIDKLYLSSSIYLMTSIQEGWGMVMSEAIEFGLPIISFDITSANEMIKNGYNGYIVKNYNQKKYVEKMLELALDKDKLKTFSINSKNISESKSDEKIVKKWLNILEKKKEFQ